MKKIYLKTTLSLLSITAISVTGVYSQNTSTGSLSFFVTDAENGYGTHAEIVLSNEKESVRLNTNEAGHLTFTGKQGEYNVTISAANHNPLTTYFVVEEGHNLDVTAIMDRQNKPKPEPTQYQTSIIEGYVIDYETGKPLANVSVALEKQEVYATTDVNGFFSVTAKEYSVIKKVADKAVRGTMSFAMAGYTTHAVENLLLVPDKLKLKIALKKGTGTTIENIKQHVLDGTREDTKMYEQSVPTSNTPKKRTLQNGGGNPSVQGCNLPTTIRVGTGCSCTSCGSVSVMSVQYYSESGVDDEWIASWDYESLAAGSVAYRSYGSWYVNNPVSANYDIASTTCNQVWNPGISNNAQNAAISTTGLVVTANGVDPARSEYSAQNNSGGDNYNCSNCNAGGSGAYACYLDNICCNTTPSGHGRGMCQWGTQYWAQNGQNAQWMIDHYFVNTVGYSLCGAGPVNNDPTSWLDANNCNTIEGWAFDQDAPGSSIDVHMYVDGNFYAVIPTNNYRPDVNSAYSQYGLTGNHGYIYTIPDGLKDCQSHQIVLYAINDQSGNNPQITSFTWGPCYGTPTNLSVTTNACPNIGVTLNWQGSGSCWWVDISTDPNFPLNGFWSSAVPNYTGVYCPGGFLINPAPANPVDSNYLSFQPNTTYYWRIWNGNSHTTVVSFTTPSCAYNNNSCSGTVSDFDGPSSNYNNNYDYTYTIAPTNASSVTLNFSAFDLENNYDYLYIHNGSTATSPQIASLTGTSIPASVTATSGVMTLHFVSDPGTVGAGFSANWSCQQSTTGIEENSVELNLSVYPNPFNSGSTVSYNLSEASQVEITLVDVLGQKIVLEKQSKQTAGKHEVAITNALNLSPGIYFIHLKVNDKTSVVKLVKEK